MKDFTAMVIYFPPKPGNARSAVGYRKTVDLLLQWAKGVLAKVRNGAVRSTFLLGCDLNDTIVQEGQNMGYAADGFKKMLDFFGLRAVNTEWKVGDTFFGNLNSSEIDYVCVPTQAMSSVKGCHLLETKAKVVQMVDIPKPHDHWPLQVVLPFEATKTST